MSSGTETRPGATTFELEDEWGFENTPPLYELLIEDLDGEGDDDAA